MDSQSLLVQYMVEIFNREQAPRISKKEEPFITISRDHGCQGNTLAILLRDELSKHGCCWRIINKEIIQESAKKLDMDPLKVHEISQSDERTAMDEVLHALSTKYYKSDRKVKQTIASVVMSTAETGSVIIVGRAAVAVTRNLKKGIHLKLYAPLEWRVSSLMKRYHATREQIIKDIHRLDLVRHKLVKDYLKPNVNVDELYDLHINTSSVSHKEIVGMVIKLMEDRGLFNH